MVVISGIEIFARNPIRFVDQGDDLLELLLVGEQHFLRLARRRREVLAERVQDFSELLQKRRSRCPGYR